MDMESILNHLNLLKCDAKYAPARRQRLHKQISRVPLVTTYVYMYIYIYIYIYIKINISSISL